MKTASAAMTFTVFSTALGPCAIAWSDLGILRLHLPERSLEETRAKMLEFLGDLPSSESKRPPTWVKDAIVRVQRHLEGDVQDFTSVRLDLSRIPTFHANVLNALRAVPARETVTYSELAHRAGSPKAIRAVGQAMAKNPIPIVVPCHRVLAAGNRPGGFSAYGGTATKARILALEGVTLGKGGGGASRARAQSKSEQDAPLFAARDALALPYDADEAVRHLTTVDARLAALIEKAGPFQLRLKETDGAFAALAESIVYQQLNGKAAATILGRVKALFPARRFFKPKDILDARDEDLRAAGLSGSKLLALRDLAMKAEQGIVPPLPALRRMTDDAIVEHLTQVRGIGRWTVEMLLIFRLGRADVLPVSDYGVRQGFRLTFKMRDLPDPPQMVKRAEKWRPFRSVASWYMWRAVDLARAKSA